MFEIQKFLAPENRNLRMCLGQALFIVLVIKCITLLGQYMQSEFANFTW